MLFEHFGQRAGTERRPAGQEGEKHPPKAVEVGPGAYRPAIGLLRGHVFHGPQHAPRSRQTRVAKQPGDAEVGKFYSAIGRKQQIGRLDIPMDYPPVVGVPQRPADLDAQPGDLAPLETAAPAEFFLQAAPLDQLHGVKQHSVLLAEAEKLHNIGMVQLAKRLDFGLEALAEALFLGQPSRQYLDRRRLVGIDVHTAIHCPHAPPAKQSDDAIRTQLLGIHGFTGYRRQRLYPS